MLLRDHYAGDPAIEFFPDYSAINFMVHLTQAKPFYRYAFTVDEQERWKDKFSVPSYISSTLFFIALGLTFFHKRIPKIKNISGWKKRVPLTLLYFSFPFAISLYL